jgi:hypothetical protein
MRGQVSDGTPPVAAANRCPFLEHRNDLDWFLLPDKTRRATWSKPQIGPAAC